MDISRIEIKINPDDLTLDDLDLFEPNGFSTRRLRSFLTRVTSLTSEQVGQLRLRDLRVVGDKIAAALRDVVPKQTSGVSPDGPGDGTTHRSGQLASPGESGSASSRSA